jgi:hypothetical protein
MKSIIFYFFIFICSSTSYSQKQDCTWLIGDQPIYNLDPYSGIVVIKFKDLGKLEIYRDTNYNIFFNGSNSSMSDKEGNFLFAFNEYSFQNNKYKSFGEDGSYSLDSYLYGPQRGPQGNIVVPTGREDNTYYAIYTTTKTGYFSGLLTLISDSLRYTEVNLNINNGSGGILNPNKLIQKDTFAAWKMSIVRNANGRDWWLLKAKKDSKEINRYLINKKGITFTGTQKLDSLILDGLGQAVYSNDGNYFCNLSLKRRFIDSYLDIFKFDRNTGLLSNHIHEFIPDTIYGGGLAISPNSRFLYLAQWNKIYQYDLKATDIIKSKTLVAEYDGYTAPKIEGGWEFATTFGPMALGPDGRIYISSVGQHFEFGVIQYPDRKGVACEVRQHYVKKPSISQGVPNNANYRLGPIDGSPADTLGIDNIPVANFRADQDTLNFLDFQFQDLSYYEPATWSWDFGDGTMSSDTSPVHSYPKKGTYVVCLTVSNTNGSNTICDTLKIGTSATESQQQTEISVYPNPAKNQVLFIMNDYYPQNGRLNLYDNLGRLQKSKKISQGWNDLNVQELPRGLYYYEVQDDGRQVYRGKLVLVE